MQQRYYDPDLGRFYANDPVGYVSQNPIQSFNRYAYGNNNPYKFVDPDGEFIFVAITVGVIAYSAYQGYQDGGAGGAVAEASGYNDAKASYNAFASGDYTGAILGAATIVCKPCKAGKNLKEGAESVTKDTARKQVMKEQGIPTSQQPISQSKNASGREYQYEVPKPGGGTQIKSVQKQTLDRSHPGQGHWEAGTVKTDPLTGEVRMNDYGRPKLGNDKSKVDYDD